MPNLAIDEEPLSSDDEFVDDQIDEEFVPNVTYDVTSYGSDPDVDGLIRRLQRKEIQIPSYQRAFVWRQPEASRFIESLLLGLPVPGVFFATDPDTNKLLVIDGQQRLKTLQFFREGYFNPRSGDKRDRVFALQKVQRRFEGKTYSDLDERDRLRFDNSVIHATIVQQTSPPGDDTSVYHIFARLNSGGRRLAEQEIRVALYRGRLMDLLHELNSYPAWRQIFGKPHSRLKDQELILRFLSLHMDRDKYERPMGEFLSQFCGRNRNPDDVILDDMRETFKRCTDLFWAAIGRGVFRPESTLNAAVYDSCMTGLANQVGNDKALNARGIESAYRTLLDDEAFREVTSRSTADKTFVEKRLDMSRRAFGDIR